MGLFMKEKRIILPEKVCLYLNISIFILTHCAKLNEIPPISEMKRWWSSDGAPINVPSYRCTKDQNFQKLKWILSSENSFLCLSNLWDAFRFTWTKTFHHLSPYQNVTPLHFSSNGLSFWTIFLIQSFSSLRSQKTSGAFFRPKRRSFVTYKIQEKHSCASDNLSTVLNQERLFHGQLIPRYIFSF